VVGHERVERGLAPVAEGGVAEVVRERYRLGEVFVEPQGPRQPARDLRDLKRVREPRAVVVALVVYEDLRLVLEAAEGLAVDDAVAVALESGSEGAGGFIPFAGLSPAAPGRVWCEEFILAPLVFLACDHGTEITQRRG